MRLCRFGLLQRHRFHMSIFCLLHMCLAQWKWKRASTGSNQWHGDTVRRWWWWVHARDKSRKSEEMKITKMNWLLRKVYCFSYGGLISAKNLCKYTDDDIDCLKRTSTECHQWADTAQCWGVCRDRRLGGWPHKKNWQWVGLTFIDYSLYCPFVDYFSLLFFVLTCCQSSFLCVILCSQMLPLKSIKQMRFPIKSYWR